VGASPRRVSGGSGPIAFLIKNFFSHASSIHYAFDMQVVTYAGGASYLVNTNEIDLPISADGGAIGGKIFVVLSAAVCKLAEQHRLLDGGYPPEITVPFSAPAAHTWHHYDVVVDLVASTMALSFDGVAQGSASLPSFYVPGQLVLTAGITYTGPNVDTFAILVDNTVAWLQ
jgi:hypothetical protein